MHLISFCVMLFWVRKCIKFEIMQILQIYLKKKKKSWVTNQTDRWLHSGTSVAHMQAAFSTCPLQCFWAGCCVAYMVILSFPIIKIFFMSSNRCDTGIYFSNFQSYSVFFVGVWLLLVSAVQHDESTVCVYISPPTPIPPS